MLSAQQWARVLPRLLPAGTTEVMVLGSRPDAGIANELILQTRNVLPDVSWVNACDGRSLGDSLSVLATSGYFLGVDSGLLHFARLFGIPSRTFWGPTNPATRLEKPEGDWSQSYYAPTICSPCIHVAEEPPCRGRNLCIEASVRSVIDPADGLAFAASVPAPIHEPGSWA
jgi:ADP-heptose:LPS heptosyltransferase